jgi:hypothetical protein
MLDTLTSSSKLWASMLCIITAWAVPGLEQITEITKFLISLIALATGIAIFIKAYNEARQSYEKNKDE